MSTHRSPILVEDDWYLFCERSGYRRAWICGPELRERLNIPNGANIRIVASTKKMPGAFRVCHDRAFGWTIDRLGYSLTLTLEEWLSSLPADILWCWVEIEP